MIIVKDACSRDLTATHIQKSTGRMHRSSEPPTFQTHENSSGH